jgi:hypothetical protein
MHSRIRRAHTPTPLLHAAVLAINRPIKLNDNVNMEDEVTVLYRPIGPRELELLEAVGWKRWPPRLPGQPFFYPVSNEQYATEIASKWNVAERWRGLRYLLPRAHFIHPPFCGSTGRRRASHGMVDSSRTARRAQQQYRRNYRLDRVVRARD